MSTFNNYPCKQALLSFEVDHNDIFLKLSQDVKLFERGTVTSKEMFIRMFMILLQLKVYLPLNLSSLTKNKYDSSFIFDNICFAICLYH